MPFIRRDVLEHLLKDDEEWKQLVRDAEAEGYRSGVQSQQPTIQGQQKLIEQQREIIDMLKSGQEGLTDASQ